MEMWNLVVPYLYVAKLCFVVGVCVYGILLAGRLVHAVERIADKLTNSP